MTATATDTLPRVLVLDGIDPAGLASLEGLAHLDVRPAPPAEELPALLAEVDAVMVRSATKVTAEALAQAKRLKVIGRAGVGVDNIDVAAATRAGILVVNSPGGNTIAAAEHTLALLMGLFRHVGPADASMKRGEWKRSKFLGAELMGRTLGVLGLGKIGGHVARVAQAMGMRVVAHDPHLPPERAAELGIPLLGVDELLAQADVVTLHLPKTAETANLLDARRLAMAKPGLRVINVARGGLIDEEALAQALETGQVAGAALDVFSAEPPTSDRLAKLGDRVLLTPHLGASTEEAQFNVAVDVAEQIAEVLQGRPARAAVNLPSLSPELLSTLGPYLPLAKRLGAFAAQLAEGPIEGVEVSFLGALAQVDTKPLAAAVLQGILGQALGQDAVNAVNAPLLAKERGLVVSSSASAEACDHSALIKVVVRSAQRRRSLAGTLVGRSQAVVVGLDEHRVHVPLEGHLILAPHTDLPGAVGRVGTVLGEAGLNLFGLQLGRSGVGGPALMVLNLDQSPSALVLERLRALEGFFDVRAVQL